VGEGRIWDLVAAAALTCLVTTASGQGLGTPRLTTHESYVEDVLRQTQLPLADPVAMFAYVLGALPSRVRVYPTENYYYFSFVHKKVRYAGNIRSMPWTAIRVKCISPITRIWRNGRTSRR